MNYRQRLTQLTTYTKTNRKTVLPIAGVIALLIIVGGVFALTRSTSSTKTVQEPQKQFTNWLKPASVINVGQLRYVSPCQILPRDAVESIYGTLPGDGSIEEKYLDRSVQDKPTIGGSYDTSCAYYYTKKSGLRVDLTVNQYTDLEKVNYVTASMPIYDREGVADSVKRIDQATANSSDTVKKFVSKLKSSETQLAQAEEEPKFTSDPTMYNGLVAIDPDSLESGEPKMAIKYNQSTYLLSYVPGQSSSKVSDSELPEIIAEFSQAYTAIIKNASSKQLDQSPAPTVLSDRNNIGSTKFLESCSIMDAAIFKNRFAIDENQPISRSSLRVNADTITRTKGIATSPSNSCVREYHDDNYSYNATIRTLNFSLNHSPSKADAIKSRDAYFKGSGSNLTTLQTDADWANVYRESPTDSYASYSFGVGAYTGRLYASVKNAGQDVPDDQAAMTQVVNQLVANLKRDQQRAK